MDGKEAVTPPALRARRRQRTVDSALFVVANVEAEKLVRDNKRLRSQVDDLRLCGSFTSVATGVVRERAAEDEFMYRDLVWLGSMSVDEIDDAVEDEDCRDHGRVLRIRTEFPVSFEELFDEDTRDHALGFAEGMLAASRLYRGLAVMPEDLEEDEQCSCHVHSRLDWTRQEARGEFPDL
jgi:hypothetical protein